MSSYGQIDPLRNGDLPYDSATTYLIEVAADRYDVRNSLNRSFIQKLFFGGYIDNDLKQSVADRFNGSNYYRGSMSPSANFTLFPDFAKYGYTFSYRYTNYIDLEFTDDLFDLIFYGNSGTAGRRAILSKSNITYQTYHSFSFGLVGKKSGSFLNLGIYDGIDYRNYKFGSTVFQTEYEKFGENEFAEHIQLSTSDSKFLERSEEHTSELQSRPHLVCR